MSETRLQGMENSRQNEEKSSGGLALFGDDGPVLVDLLDEAQLEQALELGRPEGEERTLLDEDPPLPVTLLLLHLARRTVQSQ